MFANCSQLTDENSLSHSSMVGSTPRHDTGTTDGSRHGGTTGI